MIQHYVEWRQGVEAGGRHVSGHELRDSEGRVIRGTGNTMNVIDGPYAEGRGVIGGLFIVDEARQSIISTLGISD